MKKSLKDIYKQLKYKEEILYKIKKEYSYLSSYTTDEILNYFNVKKIEELKDYIGLHKIDIKNKIEYNCKCQDRYDNIKKLYKTYLDAQKDAKRYFIKFKIYPCPYQLGWHISGIE